MGLGNEALAGMLETFGVPVALGPQSTRGFFEIVGADVLEGEQVRVTGREVAITVETGLFEDLKPGALLRVGCTGKEKEYRVISHSPIEDGTYTRILCRNAP